MNNNFTIDFQNLSNDPSPEAREVVAFAEKALEYEGVEVAELSLSVVSRDEIQRLNHQYRQQNKPTNVLSFESQLPEAVADEMHHLGDIVICADVVKQEAIAQQKVELAHWAHMVVHGVLHLLGYDHIVEEEALCMEAKEVEILQLLGFDNPY